MNDLIPFIFDGHPVRSLVIEDTPWWVGKDVCMVLGFNDTVNAMKQHCKGVAKYHPLETGGGTQEARILGEGDVFRLIVASRLPEAQRFERFLFDVMLPQIRRTGGYGSRSDGCGAVTIGLGELERLLAPFMAKVDADLERLKSDQSLVGSLLREVGRLKRRGTHMSEAEVLDIWARARRGESVAKICGETGRGETTVRGIVRGGCPHPALPCGGGTT